MKTKILFVLLSGSVLMGYSQSWSPEMMISFKRVTTASLTTDGSKVAYEVASPIMEGEKSEYITQIWVAATDGSMNRQYTFGDKSCTRARFSPDNKYLSFTSSREGKSKLYLMPLDGGEPFAITDHKYAVENYAWAPDGKNIAFLMADPLTDQEEKDKKEKRDMVVVDHYKNAHLYLLSLEKNERRECPVRRLTRGNFHITEIAWSPDSKTIAFSHQPSPSVEGWYNSDISTIPADSGEVKVIVDNNGQDYQPMFSPDGKWLAFVSDGGKASWIAISDVYIMPASGGPVKKLAATFNRDPHLVGWNPDNQSIWFDESYKTTRTIYSLPVDGKEPKMVTQANGYHSNLFVSKAGDLMAFTFQDVISPAAVMAFSLKNQQKRKLSTINDDFAKMKHARSEVISWKSKDGKYNIEGILTYPKDYQKGRKYPLILNIHGGPASQFFQTYTGAGSVFPIQAYADQGFVTLRPNPRGSGGYGSEFRLANRGDWGFGDYEDIMAGVDHLIAENIVHPDSMCVTGLSYGGFMTSWIITQTNRFKAAMVAAGVTNLVSFTNTTDIPDFIRQYFGGEMWEIPDVYMKHSPMFHVKNVKTPTLVLHGASDTRVPTSQGQELYRALQRLGVTTEMVIYPRTQHGVDEPKFILDMGQRTCDWFHKYLQK
jgi:dipeptidyl aminopeptidase/acylaminoacyl peptidase